MGRGGGGTGVPDLEADDRVCVGVDDALGHEAGADGRRHLVGLEGAFAVAHDQRRLADALGAEDDNLGLERRHCCPFVVGVWGKGGGAESDGALVPGRLRPSRLLAAGAWRPC